MAHHLHEHRSTMGTMQRQSLPPDPSSPPSPPPSTPLPHACSTPISAEPSPIVLVAKWTGYAQSSERTPRSKQSHVYTLLTQPSTPLYDGARVRLLAVSRVGFHSPTASAPSDLETYDPHVLGTISVLPPDGHGPWARASFTIANECARSSVGLVQVDVPSLAGILRDTPQRAAFFDRTTGTYMVYTGDPVCEGDCRGANCEQHARYARMHALRTKIDGDRDREVEGNDESRNDGYARNKEPVRQRRMQKKSTSTISRFGWIERDYAFRY